MARIKRKVSDEWEAEAPSPWDEHPCVVCARAIPAEPPRRGAPKSYCCAECADLATTLSRLEATLNRVVPRLKQPERRALRAILWGMTNKVNLGGKA
jgi:hypothetical protein